MAFAAIIEAREDAKKQLSTLREAINMMREQRIRAESQARAEASRENAATRPPPADRPKVR